MGLYFVKAVESSVQGLFSWIKGWLRQFYTLKMILDIIHLLNVAFCHPPFHFIHITTPPLFESSAPSSVCQCVALANVANASQLTLMLPMLVNVYIGSLCFSTKSVDDDKTQISCDTNNVMLLAFFQKLKPHVRILTQTNKKMILNPTKSSKWSIHNQNNVLKEKRFVYSALSYMIRQFFICGSRGSCM